MHHLPEIAIIEPNTLTALGYVRFWKNLFPRQSYVRFFF